MKRNICSLQLNLVNSKSSELSLEILFRIISHGDFLLRIIKIVQGSVIFSKSSVSQMYFDLI